MDAKDAAQGAFVTSVLDVASKEKPSLIRQRGFFFSG